MSRSVLSNFRTFIISTLILCLIFNSNQQFHSCYDLVQQWIEDPKKLPPLVFANSGKFLNDFGDYNNCMYNSQDYVYITMSVINKFASNYQHMGLCAPIQCKQFIVSNENTQDFQNMLNQVFKNATNSTYDPFIGMKLYSPADNQPQMDWSNYLTLIFIGFLVFLGIVGSILSKIAPQTRSLPLKVIKCFSFYDNFGKIIVVPKTVQNDNLLFLNGLRVFSILWIVYGHDEFFRFMNIRNWLDSLDIIQKPGLATLAPSAYYAVDVFFWIGGFLITMGMLQQMKKRIKFIPFYIGCIIHRFIRIWPTYMVAILMYWKVFPYFGSGPIWRTYYDMSCQCNDGGVIWNMFFVDNFGDHGASGRQYCFGWGWYLAVDFQLFLITPFLFFIYKKSKKFGWLVTFLLFLACIVTAFVMIMVNDWRYPLINPKLKPQPQFMDKFYYKPYIRASAYFMGIFSGYIYYQWKNGNQKFVKIIDKIKNSILIRVLFYIFGIALTQITLWMIIPVQQGEQWSTVAQAFYNSLNRVFFTLGVFLLVFAAMFGCKNDPVKFILGHAFFSPLAKISFCLYLTHFIVIISQTLGAKVDLYWQSFSILYHVVTDIVYSLVLALILSLLVQSPTLGLQKIFLRGGDKKKTQQISKKDIQSLQKSYSNIQQGQDIKQKLMKDFQQYSQDTNSSNNSPQKQKINLL